MPNSGRRIVKLDDIGAQAYILHGVLHMQHARECICTLYAYVANLNITGSCIYIIIFFALRRQFVSIQQFEQFDKTGGGAASAI